MAGSIAKFCQRMLYWCSNANLGYDQGNRWDIRVGGESNCSSLVIFALREAGFDTGDASYTGDLSYNLTRRGWKRIAADISTCKPGDILLNDECHVCAVVSGSGWNAKVAQASIDENGRARGGQAGDQSGSETNVRSVYTYSRGWDCILRYEGADDATSATDQAGSDRLEVDGWLGTLSVSEWQRQLGTTIDGEVSGQMPEYRDCFPRLASVTWEGGGSTLMRKVQSIIGVPGPTGIAGPHTVALLQAWLVGSGYSCGSDDVAVLGEGTAMALQRSLNDGKWK